MSVKKVKKKSRSLKGKHVTAFEKLAIEEFGKAWRKMIEELLKTTGGTDAR